MDIPEILIELFNVIFKSSSFIASAAIIISLVSLVRAISVIGKGKKSHEYKGISWESFCIFLNKFFPSWKGLRGLSKNRIFRLSYVWIFLVPLIAKLLSNSEKGINLILQKSPELSISLSVPFNWNLFYFAALLYVIGNIIYFWKAPEVIKNYDNFKDFEEKDKSGFLIMNSVENFLDDHNEYNDYLNQVYYYFKWRHNIELPEPDEREELKNELMMRINDDRLSNLFAISASFIDRKRLPSRAFSTALYSFSVCLYGYVIIEQSVFVFTEFFSHYSFS